MPAPFHNAVELDPLTADVLSDGFEKVTVSSECLDGFDRVVDVYCRVISKGVRVAVLEDDTVGDVTEPGRWAVQAFEVRAYVAEQPVIDIEAATFGDWRVFLHRFQRLALTDAVMRAIDSTDERFYEQTTDRD